MEKEELTYLDHLKGQSKVIYNQLNEVLRHVNLDYKDIDGIYGLFNESFYTREDITDSKKETIKSLEKKLRKLINDNKDLDPNLFLDRD